MFNEIFGKVKDIFSNPMITVVIGAVVAFIIIRFIYRKIFKRNSVRLVVSVITVCIIIFAIVLYILAYFEGAGQVYLEDDMNYVYGKVVYVDTANLEIKVNVIRSNIKKGGTGEVYGIMSATTKVMYNNKAIEEKLTSGEIKTGDYVFLVTNDEEVKKQELSVRAVLKQEQSSIFSKIASIFFNERTEIYGQ